MAANFYSMYKLLVQTLILIFAINLVSCDGNKNDDPDPTPGLESCNDVDPMVIIQEGGSDLELNGFIWGEVLQDVHHIELISHQPVFGSAEGDNMIYNVSSVSPDGTLEDKTAWRFPFTVNQTSTDYILTVVYYCNPDDSEGGVPGGDEDGDAEPFESYKTDFNYNPGNLCDPGGESLFIWDDRILVNDIEDVATITGQTFNIKWPTRPPASDNEGFLFLYPIEEIESASLEMEDIFGENKLTDQFIIDWFITNKPVDVGGASFDLAYLSANIDISHLVAGMSQEELDNYRSIKFTIRYCGGKEHVSFWQLDL